MKRIDTVSICLVLLERTSYAVRNGTLSEFMIIHTKDLETEWSSEHS